MKVHFIAIGGAVMHSLAIALKQAGHEVTGSDDKIFDPAKSRLTQYELLPLTEGWDENRITSDLDAVILGMHAFEDNPELAKAKALGLKIYSYPEFIYEQSKNKQRVVITGSYGKTTITSMVMHVLKGLNYSFDYLVGSQVEGFENPVSIKESSYLTIIEGDEYLASKLDKRPKFLVYQPHIALISGISWDHINVFPTEEAYNQQFEQLIQTMPKAGYILYNEQDKLLKEMVKAKKDSETMESLYIYPFHTPSYKVRDGKYTVSFGENLLGMGGTKQEVSVFGKHNMTNIAAAWKVCEQLAVEVPDFLKHIATFKGAKSRLELVVNQPNRIVFKDFAHAPIKVLATVEAVLEMYPKRNVIACLELHTFSSLNKEYLKQYANTLQGAAHKIVFINKHIFAQKRISPIEVAEIQHAFADRNLHYVTDSEQLSAVLRFVAQNKNDVFLMMSSGDFGGIDLTAVGK
ncbi:MAG: UDP-N-acetylmuramate--L-alanine ligase [Bacteroidia bacterium]